MASSYQYHEVANLLDAVKQLMSHFEQYTDIPKIANIKFRTDTLQKQLYEDVKRDFRKVGEVLYLI
jgi:hypothetical protein